MESLFHTSWSRIEVPVKYIPRGTETTCRYKYLNTWVIKENGEIKWIDLNIFMQSQTEFWAKSIYSMFFKSDLKKFGSGGQNQIINDEWHQVSRRNKDRTPRNHIIWEGELLIPNGKYLVQA